MSTFSVWRRGFVFSIAALWSVSASVAAWGMQDDVATDAKAKRAEEKRMSRIWKTVEPVEGFETRELFSSMESGEIEVVYKQVDPTKATVIVKNTSDKPLAIEMPPAFAGVPVMAQMGMGGGGMGGMGGGMGGGGMFNIPPGQTGKLNVRTFCLEHGKPDPRPQMAYTIRPLSVLTSDAKIEMLCRALAADRVTPNVAQAAAWNLANGLNWNYLATKNRVELMDGYTERFFHPNELIAAQQLVVWAARQVEYEAMAKRQDSGLSSEEYLKRAIERDND